MNEDKQDEAVEQALLQMATFDARDAAIARAEAEGAIAQTPQLSSARVEAIISASLHAAELPAAVKPPPEQRASLGVGRIMVWACAAAAVAAAVMLWGRAAPKVELSASPAIAAAPLPAARLQLGGTARTLGGAPPVRPYGPGDAFVLQLVFAAKPAAAVFAEVSAHDATGASRRLRFKAQSRGDTVLFEGEIARHLPRGAWTLQVQYGPVGACSASNRSGCQTLQTRIEVVDP